MNRIEGEFSRKRTWLVAVVIIAVIAAFMFGGDGLLTSITLGRRVAQLEARVDSLAKRNELLNEKLIGLKSGDLNTLEEEARSHGMIKPGEKVYLLQPNSERKKR